MARTTPIAATRHRQASCQRPKCSSKLSRSPAHPAPTGGDAYSFPVPTSYSARHFTEFNDPAGHASFVAWVEASLARGGGGIGRRFSHELASTCGHGLDLRFLQPSVQRLIDPRPRQCSCHLAVLIGRSRDAAPAADVAPLVPAVAD